MPLDDYAYTRRKMTLAKLVIANKAMIINKAEHASSPVDT